MLGLAFIIYIYLLFILQYGLIKGDGAPSLLVEPVISVAEASFVN